MSDFKTERDYLQALGRVGRHREKCHRFIVEGLKPVDKREELRRTNKLMRVLEPPRKTKKKPVQTHTLQFKRPAFVTELQSLPNNPTNTST